jgi:hypothetical protein
MSVGARTPSLVSKRYNTAERRGQALSKVIDHL